MRQYRLKYTMYNIIYISNARYLHTLLQNCNSTKYSDWQTDQFIQKLFISCAHKIAVFFFYLLNLSEIYSVYILILKKSFDILQLIYHLLASNVFLSNLQITNLVKWIIFNSSQDQESPFYFLQCRYLHVISIIRRINLCKSGDLEKAIKGHLLQKH